MTIDEYFDIVEALPFGKQLPGAVYIYRYSRKRLPEELRKLIQGAYIFYDVTQVYNVLKLYRREPIITFLSYPTFLTEAHPALHRAIRVNYDKKLKGSQKTDYRSSGSPPILHRKECMLPEGFPGREDMIALTKAEEELGLYEDTTIIGTRKIWEKLLREKGVTHVGHQLVKIT